MASCFQSLFFLLFSLLFSTLCPAFQHSCSHQESLLLLDFKNSFTKTLLWDKSGFPSVYCIEQSYLKTLLWDKSRDCCSWEGVTCDNITNQVVELDLSCSQLEGTIGSNSSLFHLSHLRRLNLAYNTIKTSQISKLFGNFTHLTHLNLSRNQLAGQVPSEILKLTELVSLDLSFNLFTLGPNIFKLLLTNFTKLSQVYLSYADIFSSIPKNLSTSLQNIDLSGNNLQGKVPEVIFHLPNLKELGLVNIPQLYVILPTIRWNSSSTLEYLQFSETPCLGGIPDSIGMLKVLKFLDISDSRLSGSLPKEMLINMTQLEVIDLSSNRLTGSLPWFPREIKTLTSLSLSGNSLSGSIFLSRIFSLTSLQILYLDNNQLYGPIPVELSSLINLEILGLSYNNLTGPIPVELSSVVSLQEIDLSSNNLNGHVEADIFSNMKQLGTLDLSHNRLSLLIKNNSILPKYIQTLGLASCNITELEFLRSLTQLSEIDLSMNNILEVPSWLWSMWENLTSLNISYNSISSAEEINFPRINLLDLRSNILQGPFPHVTTDINILLISNNQFFGVIPPSILCRLSSIAVIDLSSNNFTGTIPMCVGNMSQSMSVLDMSLNNFQGTIPNNFSSSRLVTLNLHGNHLSGSIPSSLAQCMNLKVLDLGNNNFNDTFPSWLGGLPELRVLSLRSNNFHGKISSSSTTSFSNLQILDLSDNQFIGVLPEMFFRSFTGIMVINETREPASYIGGGSYYMDSTVVVNKGIEFKLDRILTTWTTVDISSNNFKGNMPSSIGRLISVRQLNLSNNRFAGDIPISFGNLSVLESLDLCSNQLSGTIPSQLTTLYSLSKLNLTYNNLTGRIPGGTQFQTFENDSYIGNDGLCGTPLSKICIGDEVYSPGLSQSLEPDDSDFIDGFSWRSVLIGYGVGIVFGVGIGCLMFFIGKPKCLIRFVEDVGYGIAIRRGRNKKFPKRIVRMN